MAAIYNVIVEGSIIRFYDKCGDLVYEFDLCDAVSSCGFETNPGEDPGKWPDPIDTPDTRCRVAMHLGLLVANRLNEFLDGLILNFLGSNIPGAYAMLKIQAWGWPVTAYQPVVDFIYSLFTGGGSGRGEAAKNDWTNGSTEDVFNTRKTLYCSIDDTGAINATVREVWALSLEAMTTSEFEPVLADFIRIYPLENLRADAFTASTTEGAVDCSAFDCEGEIGSCSDPIDALFDGQLVADYGFVPVLNENTSQFPGFAITTIPDRVINTERNVRGWLTIDYCDNAPCEAAAIVRTFSTPYTLCYARANIGKLNANGSTDKGNTRHGGIWVKYTGQSTWTALAVLTAGIGVNPVTISPTWSGVAQIDALAVVCAVGGSDAHISSIRLNTQ